MGSGPDLRSALAKFEWAKQHSERLQSDIRRWANRKGDPVVGLRRKFKPHQHRVEFWVESVRPPRAEWSLMAGNILNDYRSALDHLAWQLWRSAGSKAPPENRRWREHRVQFPICDSTRRDFFTQCRTDRLPGVGIARLSTLSKFQPYGGGQIVPGPKGVRHNGVLRSLMELTRTDKHHELLLMVLRPWAYHITPPAGCTITPSAPPGAMRPFETGTHIVNVRVEPWNEPKPDVRVYLDPAGLIAFENGDWLNFVLGNLSLIVAEILGEFV